MKATLTQQQVLEFGVEFGNAVEEAISDVDSHVAKGGAVPRHYNFPYIIDYPSPFPSIGESALNDAPYDYGGVVNRKGLGGLLIQSEKPIAKLESVIKLIEYIEQHEEFREYFRSAYQPDELKIELSKWPVYEMVSDVVERYCHLHGTKLDPEKTFKVFWPVVRSIVGKNLDLAMIVPITLLKFDFDRLPLAPGQFIMRMSDALQKSRVSATDFGAGVHKNLIPCATHAFVSRRWTINNESTHSDLTSSLRQVRSLDTKQIDNFFAALRAATGRETGYTQILYLPRRWTTGYRELLPTVYGATVRRYPSSFDNFGWMRHVNPITREEGKEIRRLYVSINQQTHERLPLALRRLNSCLIRDDEHDAILDAAIGLEILLCSDGNKGEITYRLKMRAAALTKVDSKKRRSSDEVYRGIDAVYKRRSAIVHGSKGKQRKTVQQTHGVSEDQRLATDMLRYVIDVLLENPKYLDPRLIDKELLYGHAPVQDPTP